MAWFSNRTPEEKAADFDQIDEIVTRNAREKQARGEYPYDTDAAIRDAGEIADPKEERRGRHRR